MQLVRKSVVRILFVVSLPPFLSLSCSTVPIEKIPSNANPTAEIDKLERNLVDAQNEQVNVLSPNYFNESRKALIKAKKARSEDKKSEVILDAVAVGQGNLKKARERSGVTKAALEPVIVARTAAIAAEAPRLVERDFRDADKALIEVTEDIENNKLGSAERHRNELMQKYSQVELRAIKEKNLGEARQVFLTAEREGARKHAQKSFKEVEEQLKEADRNIAIHRQDQTMTDSIGKSALTSARHLLEVTRRSKFMNKQDAESIVLEEEKQAQKIQALKQSGQQTAEKLAQVQGESRALESANKQLESHRRIDATLESAKSIFDRKEAEAYRDGERLVLRLKQLAFPVGKATLTPEAMPLLAKVNATIRDLGTDSTIEIQGHTDSSGSAAMNQKLSEERAKAIKAYLVANGLEEKNIKTIGYGQTKPIAVNKTKEGRAQNRRVDIIIEPRIPLS